MSFLKELFDGRLRRARSLEGRGDFRGAAGLYAEAGMPLEAAKALLHAAERASKPEERVAAWLDALRTLPEGAHDLRKEAEIKLGRSVLSEAQAHGAAGTLERDRLADAAERLERNGAFTDAADAWELLGQKDDLARCLELGGEIERLEAVLGKTNDDDAASAKIRRLVSEAELAAELGDRDSARTALREAVALAPNDVDLLRMLRELEGRWIGGRRVVLSYQRAGVSVGLTLVGRLPVTLGRSDADVVVRGGSVSRSHCELYRQGGALFVKDLGSRNGTLVKGIPIAAALRLEGSTEVGLGEDATIRVVPLEEGADIEVLRGLDRGQRTLAGTDRLPLPGLRAEVVFEGDRTLLSPLDGASIRLGARTIHARIDLLLGDAPEIDGVRLEVGK